jgi:magnesium transporter
VLILKEGDRSDMLRRIGTCRKKVMGLLRLMSNKADVVKGLAKRCNENWRSAPTSDIVSSFGTLQFIELNVVGHLGIISV